MRILSLLRPLLRVLPFQVGKGRLSSILDPCEIPEGRLIRMKSGVTVKLYSDLMYRAPYLFGEYEVQHTKVIQTIVRPGDVCLDIGANFGYYTALLSKLVGSHGTVHAFEPLPSFYNMATETVHLNNASSTARLHNFGLGSISGTFTVYTFAGLPQGHASSNDMNRRDAVPHICSITTLDEFVESHGISKLDFMKVDVEGDEVGVFRGGRRLLSAPGAPAITFEINPECLSDRGLVPANVQGVLEEYGYSHFFRIPHQGPVRQISKVADSYFDYLALKPGHLHRFPDQGSKLEAEGQRP